jgi:PAS domain S-box-containing protein
LGVLSGLFDPSGLTPHGFCLLWQPGLIALHAISDALTALAYFSIPICLTLFFKRRNDLAFGWIYIVFAAFILSCGLTHVMSIVTLWFPLYQLEGVIKLITAVMSAAAAIAVWYLMPQALALPSPTALRNANQALSDRIVESEDAQRRLRESEARQRRMFVKFPATIYSMDPDGTINEASDAMAELLGTTRRAMIGRRIDEFVPAEEHADRHAARARLLRTGEAREFESRFLTADGRVIDVLISSRLEKLGGDFRDNILAVATDVTARRRAEAALRDSEERLRQSQKMEAIGKLTGGIAHDFNNMLTVIDGNLDRLRGRVADDALAEHLVDQAALASQRADALIAQLLAFSRQQRLDPQPIHAYRVIDDMRTLLSDVAGKQIRLSIEHDVSGPGMETDVAGQAGDAGWLCLADRHQLGAAVVNLVLNASHAIAEQPAGPGEIRIMVTETLLRPLDDWRDGGGEQPEPGAYVRVAVTDNGIGMSDEIRRRALEPFFTTKEVGRGSGLGLSQTYGFVRQSGGAMRIESTPGRGTTVEMLLPRAHAMPLEAGNIIPLANRFPSAGEHSGTTLLVVEDEPAVLDIAASTLRDSGFRVIAASDAAGALAALEATPDIALVFTDIVMPGKSGVALAREIWRVRPGMKVIFASGYSEESLTAQLPVGAWFVKKPYKISAVVTLIQDALNEPGLVQAANA